MTCVLCLLFFLVSFLLAGCQAGVYHTVKPGQNLYRISRTYNVDEAYLARVNGISDPTQIAVGSRIFIPGADRVRYVPVVKTVTSPVKQSHKIVSRSPPVKKTPAHKPVAKKTQPRSDKKRTSQPQATTVTKLHWPLRGKVLSSFSSRAKAGSGRGIEISAKLGSAVLAAEAGKVIYSGDGVNGYAHLIILQHENNLFTVYGFNRKNLVKQGDFVSRGERIALSGRPPAGGQPRLHFEVRKGKKAVDPLLYLP